MDFFTHLQQQSADDSNKQMTSTNPKNSCENGVLYENFKKGDMIRVVKYKNSSLNYYKGYVGEIKVYRKGQEYAMVILHAQTNMQQIRMPLHHLEKYESI